MGILLVVALVLAWPTFGLSVVAWLIYAYVRSKSDRVIVVPDTTSDRIAKIITEDEAFANGAVTTFSALEIELFYNRYGSTHKRFEYKEDLNLYTGYVILPYYPHELLFMAHVRERSILIYAHELPMVFGQDILGLMAKKQFEDEMVELMIGVTP